MLILCVLAARAGAQPYEVPETAVTWHAPTECGDGAELRRRVGGYLQHDLGAAPFAIVDVAAKDDGTYHAELHLGANGQVVERTVEGKDCTQVIDAVALVIGLAAQSPDGGAETNQFVDDVELHGIEAPPEVVTRRLGVRVRGAVDVGTMPGGGAGLDAGLAFTHGRLAVIASVRWFPHRFSSLEGTPDAGVDVGLTGGAGEACVRVVGGWACAGGEVARISGAGMGLVDSRTNTSTWSAATLGIAGELALGARARFVVELGGYFATQRPRFVLDDRTVLYEPSLIGARLYTGIEATLF
ncbi:MAG TPA: hypothetical protein VL463_05435 [Kofleriaceae bacterium]|nr:hypothetical protein [Kofleriaceae bacterium]